RFPPQRADESAARNRRTAVALPTTDGARSRTIRPGTLSGEAICKAASRKMAALLTQPMDCPANALATTRHQASIRHSCHGSARRLRNAVPDQMALLGRLDLP